MEVLNITDSAKFVGVDRNTIYKWIKQGKLELYKDFPYHNYIKKKDLLPFKNTFYNCNSMAEKVHKAKQNNFIWTEEMKQVIDGLLLSDGYLYHYKNRQFIDYYFTLLSISSEFCEFIKSILPQGLFRDKIYKKIKNNNFNPVYTIKSRSDPYLTEQRKRWYPDNKKIIPDDLRLTPIVCYYWYVGDGYLSNRDGRRSHIHLYTDGFEKNEIENILIKQLINSGINAHTFKHYKPKDRNKGYAIRIPTDSTEKFLFYIGKSKIRFFDYKWDFQNNCKTAYFNVPKENKNKESKIIKNG